MPADLITAEEAGKLLEAARQHVYRLADGSERFQMSIPPRAEKDSDFVLLAPCDIAEAALADLAAVRLELEAAREERDRLRDILRCERGEWAPEGWTRNDLDTEREGVAYYRRWEADGSDPGDDDTPCTMLAWVRREDGHRVEWLWEIEYAMGIIGDFVATGEAPTALEAIEAADLAAKEGA